MIRAAPALVFAFAPALLACDANRVSASAGTSSGAADEGVASSASASDPGTGLPTDLFELSFRDEFDSFDGSRWSKASHSFPENLAQFDPTNAEIRDGHLVLRVDPAGTGEDKAYRAAEVRTLEHLLYGRFVARMRMACGSGLVSAMFTFHDRDLGERWSEIDIEHLGRYDDRFQSNFRFGNSSALRDEPELHELEFDPAADFHDYEITWTPFVVTLAVDGTVVRSASAATVELLRYEQKLMFNLWPAALPGWAGGVDADSLPASMAVDWIEVWDYVGD